MAVLVQVEDGEPAMVLETSHMVLLSEDEESPLIKKKMYMVKER